MSFENTATELATLCSAEFTNDISFLHVYMLLQSRVSVRGYMQDSNTLLITSDDSNEQGGIVVSDSFKRLSIQLYMYLEPVREYICSIKNDQIADKIQFKEYRLVFAKDLY